MTRFRRSGTNWEGRAWVVAAPIRSLAEDIEDVYPSSHLKDGTVAGRAHDANSPNSDHRPKPISGAGRVRAIDFGEHDEEVDEILEGIRVSRDSRIKYGIHHGRMFSSYSSGGVPPYTWRPYTRGGHIDHGHVSTLPSADNQAGAWDIGLSTGDDDMLPIVVGDDTEDQTALADMLNQTYGSSLKLVDPYNGAMVAVVKQFLGRYTGHPDWKEGRGVGGKQYSRLIQDYIKKVAPTSTPAPPLEVELDVVKVSVVKGVKIK